MPNNEPRQIFFVITSLEDINSLMLFVNKKIVIKSYFCNFMTKKLLHLTALSLMTTLIKSFHKCYGKPRQQIEVIL